MRLDLYNTIVTDEAFPGNIGDSCANTARYALSEKLSGTTPQSVDLLRFRTETGYVRHPSAPDGPPISKTSWREPDFTSDQALPLLMAYRALCLDGMYEEMCSRVRWRTSPNHISSIGVMLVSRDWLFLFWLSLMFQAFLFLLPYRWSDDDRLEGKWWKLEKSAGSTADYLNYAASAQYLKIRGYDLLSYLTVWVVGAENLKLKILTYHNDGTRFVVASHFTAIDRITG